MQNILTNWKTSVAGLIVIAMGLLGLVGIHVPGFTDPGLGVDLTVGIGLIVSSDSSTTAAKTS